MRFNHKIFALIIIINILVSGLAIIVKVMPKKEDNTTIIVNPVGYLAIDRNKTFLLKTDSHIGPVPFQIINNSTNKVVYSGNTTYLGYLWNSYYSQGNFSAISTNGNYTVSLQLNNKEYQSYKFEISNNVYLKFINLLYEFFYYQRCGCEVVNNVVPGYVGHAACHLDDATNLNNESDWLNLTGGWHDAGDYNKYSLTTAIALLGLEYSFEMGYNLFTSPDYCNAYPRLPAYSYQNNQTSDLLEEIIWGANFMSKLVLPNGSVIVQVGSNDKIGWYGYWGIPSMETDGNPNTPDNRVFYTGDNTAGAKCAASLLKAAEILNSSAFMRSEFSREIQNYMNNGLKAYKYYHSDPMNFTSSPYYNDILVSDMSLYNLTGNDIFKNEANFIGKQFLTNNTWYNFSYKTYNYLDTEDIPGFLFYWVENFNGSSEMKVDLADQMNTRLNTFWDPMSSSSDANDFYHLLRCYTPKAGEYYFKDYKNGGFNIGENSYYIEAAWASILAYNVTGEYKFLDFALNQINWILGKNPYSLTMVEGVGYKNMAEYHNRASTINGNSRGAMPGAVPNGFIREPYPGPNSTTFQDAPYYDMSTPTIENNHADFSSNEPWLPHNSDLLLAISAIYKYALDDVNF